MNNLNWGKSWHSLILALVIWFSSSERVESSSEITNNCPDEIDSLTGLLLADLPDYANRVIQRTQDLNKKAGVDNYIISAGKADFEPLNLPKIQYNPVDFQSPEQIFFTVLERQYRDREIREIQTYHWLFLAPSESGWRMVMLFSRFGDGTENNPPTPPLETSDGIIGQGIRLWLRDCRAGRISGGVEKTE
ncbi:hypothetical protein [Myxosarcina sp. GI1(2024)]